MGVEIIQNTESDGVVWSTSTKDNRKTSIKWGPPGPLLRAL